MVDQITSLDEGTKLMILAPMINDRKGEHLHLFEQLRSQGFVRVRVDGIVVDMDDIPELDKNKKHTIEVVIDRIKVRKGLEQRLAESLETALELTGGTATACGMDENSELEILFSSQFACPVCGYSITDLEPRMFSFNNPAGACGTCDGLGVDQYFDPDKIIVDETLTLGEGAIRGWDRRTIYYFQMLSSVADHYGFNMDTPFKKLSKKNRNAILFGTGEQDIEFNYVNSRGDTVIKEHPFEGVIPNLQRRYHETDSAMVREDLSKLLSVQPCPSCEGSRLKQASRNVFVDNHNIADLTAMPIGPALKYFQKMKLPGRKGEIAKKIQKEIQDRLHFLVNVGLDYLSLERSADTLSGGEAQRIRLASQIGAGLVGVMYILDEPSIGLHQRDNDRLLKTLEHLRDLGNTVIVVEHDEDAIRAADYIIDIGPGAGVHGGEVIFAGLPKNIGKCKESITGQYITGTREIAVPKNRTPINEDKQLVLTGATGNNLADTTLKIPVGLFTCVTGVSGSGKSTLINQTLYPLAATALNNASTLKAAPYKTVEGMDHFDKCVDIDQSPIGRTPRSNPATYTGIFTAVRDLFTGTEESRSRGYKAGRFSFNVKGGRCEACQGDGVIKVEMHFLADVYVPCDVCHGKRYNRETLDIRYKGKNIHEVLDMTVEEGLEFFEAIPALKRKLQTLMDVGLTYVRLGQNATTLSGGEAQRVKLAKELSKRDTGQTLYILDEPTTGLHFHDIQQLLDVLHRLRDHGNTIVVIEHNLDVIKTADWVIDLGPEGGSGGGQIVAQGTPESVAKVKGSHTAKFLKPMLKPKA